MMWKSIDTAPKGEYYTVKNGKGERTIHKPVWVHTWRKDGHRTISYFMPHEQRWNGYTKDAPPDMWHPYPEPPENTK